MALKLPKLVIHDLLRTARSDSLVLRGRDVELERMARCFGRHEPMSLVVTGPRGIGKTALIRGLAQAVDRGQFPKLRPLPYLQLDTRHLVRQLRDTHTQEEMITHVRSALASLPACIMVLDDVQQLQTVLPEAWQWEDLLAPFVQSTERRLLMTMPAQTLATLQDAGGFSPRFFETLALVEVSRKDCRQILFDTAPRLSARYGIQVTRAALQATTESLHQWQHGVALPQKALAFLDEVATSCRLQGTTVMTDESVRHVLAQRTGGPTGRLNSAERQKLHDLPQRLARHICGQPHVVADVAQTLQRGWLGLRSEQRPLGSFLFLGPSGVGKTEMARVLAREMYGSDTALVRIDMSEYGEAHAVQRLLGAPPGYVGYEAGGQLTNPIQQQPFSLVLLDEIEKAHPTIFDIFLQVLEDGRLTDGQGHTVDFTKTIIMATSNLGLTEIIAAATGGVDVTAPTFRTQVMLPLLLERFRAEFINRFEAVTVFAPLSVEALLEIGHLELRKIERRLARHQVRFAVSDAMLRRKITEIADLRFGARPLKRFLEQVAESATANTLLNKHAV